MDFHFKKVPDIQRYIWTNPNALEVGIVWDRREYPLNMKVDFKGQDARGLAVLAEAKNRAKMDDVYQAVAQKYRYLYSHPNEDFRMILVCYTIEPDAKEHATSFNIEVIELGEPMVQDIVADYDDYKSVFSRRQFEAFGFIYVKRLSISETAIKMGISIPRVSTLKKEIDQHIERGMDELVALIQIMKQAPEVFKEPLEAILEA